MLVKKINGIMNKIKESIKDIFDVKEKRITFICFITLPFIINLIIELLSRKSLIKLVEFVVTNPIVFLCNVLIIFVTMSLALLFKRRIFVMSIVSVVWAGFGVTNFILRLFRETPFSATDFRLISSGITIMDKYVNFVGFLMIGGLIVLVIALIVFLFLKSPKYDAKINYIKNLIIIAVVMIVAALTINISLMMGTLSTKFSNLTEAYFDYGFVYCFANSCINTGVKKPSGYDNTSIENIADTIEKTVTVNSDEKKTPNIIFLQLESFFDITKMTNLQLSQDPIPNFNALKAQFPSGYLGVNNVGYGTANTEFEVMTGMNLDDFGPGEFPYKTVLTTTTCESIAYNLKENGYMTHAMHDNVSTFYERHKIFPKLGYDNFTSLESMNVEEYTDLGWAKDKYMTEEILKLLKASETPDFIYSIAVQSHGSYPSVPTIEDPVVTVSGIDEERLYSFEYYVNAIYEVDMFIGELVAELSALDEETILVMYGDHLPSLGITEEEVSNGDLYQTEYVIWNNIGLKLEDKDLETYEIASRVLQSINIDTGIINKFHQVYDKKSEKEYREALQALEYDILYGKKYVYDGINPYIETEMTLGIDEIVVEKIDKFDGITIEPDDDYYVVTGKNFTEYCVVTLNGEAVETEYVNETALRIPYTELMALDSIVVQLREGATLLKESDEFLYITNSEE